MHRGRTTGGLSLGLSLVAILGCRREAPFQIAAGAEPAGTCAIEGWVSGRTGPGEAATFALSWRRLDQPDEGAMPVRVTLAGGRFRIAGLRLDARRHYSLAGRAGAAGLFQHSTLGGNYDALSLGPGERASGVRLDVAEGASFRGQVRDAVTGAAVTGVRVEAERRQYGRWGWQRPSVFAVTDSEGQFVLSGVALGELVDAQRPQLRFYHPRYGSEVVEARAEVPGVWRLRPPTDR